MAVSPVGSGNNAGTNSNPTSTPIQDPLTQKDTFLKLMVAQIKNQDPLNPTDPNQFLGQLAQFTELEQMMNLRTDVEAINKTLTSMAGTGTGTDSTQETN